MTTSIQFSWVVFLALFAGCAREQLSEPLLNLFGAYESSRFIEPGSSDGGIDIQSAGGYVRIWLHESGDFVARLYVPEHLPSNYPAGHSSYSGRFTVSGDIIDFVSGGFIVEKLRWDKEKAQLETLEVPKRGQPFKIVLYKYSR